VAYRASLGSTKGRPAGSYGQEVPDSADTLLEQIEALYRERFADFVGVAAAVVGDRDTGWDAVQDAFASIVRHRRSFRYGGTLEAWVWRVVINAARKRRRRLRREAGRDDVAATNGTAPEPRELSELGALVAALPERQRLVLFLRYYADLEYREIAQILQVTTGTVSASLHAAHATLRQSLTEVHT
jgi:RNA polymerase sigma factor (sigma-70 family)